MKRYRILAAAVVMQMCLGATYAWSVFVLPLKQVTGLLQAGPNCPFERLGSFAPALWSIGGLLIGGAAAHGLGRGFKTEST